MTHNSCRKDHALELVVMLMTFSYFQREIFTTVVTNGAPEPSHHGRVPCSIQWVFQKRGCVAGFPFNCTRGVQSPEQAARTRLAVVGELDCSQPGDSRARLEYRVLASGLGLGSLFQRQEQESIAHSYYGVYTSG